MHILVTGGAGFIGSHTVVALSEAGYTPVIVDDFSNADKSVLDGLTAILGKKVICYEGDCGDKQLLQKIFNEQAIQGVIHFAAFKAVGESMSEPLKYYRNNLGTLVALLESMVSAGIPDLIFSSSCTVYGDPAKLPVTEASPVQQPESVYGNTKKVGEEILRDCQRAELPLRSILLRYFNPVGAHPSGLIGELPSGVPSNLVPFVMQTGAGLRPQLTVFGDDYDTPDGTCIRDYIHVMDLAEAHVAALAYLKKLNTPNHCDVFNVGTGKGASVMELIRTYEAVSGRKLPFTIGARRSGDVPMVYADPAKIQREMGWSASRSLEAALADAWRWQQNIG